MSDAVREGANGGRTPVEEDRIVLLGSSQQLDQPICNVKPLEVSRQFQGWPRRNLILLDVLNA